MSEPAEDAIVAALATKRPNLTLSIRKVASDFKLHRETRIAY